MQNDLVAYAITIVGFRQPLFDLDTAAKALPGVPKKAIRNYTDRELIKLTTPPGEQRRYSAANLIELTALHQVSTGGSALRVGMLIATASSHRMEARIKLSLIGTRNDMCAMVYHFDLVKSRGGSIGSLRSAGGVLTDRLLPDFCVPAEIEDTVAKRWKAGAVEVRVFPVDELIEGLVDRMRGKVD